MIARPDPRGVYGIRSVGGFCNLYCGGRGKDAEGGLKRSLLHPLWGRL